MTETRAAFDQESKHDQIGLHAHKAVTTQLLALSEQFEGDPESVYAALCGALAGVANFALMIAKPDSYREMQALMLDLVPWAFDQAARMVEAPKMDG